MLLSLSFTELFIGIILLRLFNEGLDFGLSLVLTIIIAFAFSFSCSSERFAFINVNETSPCELYFFFMPFTNLLKIALSILYFEFKNNSKCFSEGVKFTFIMEHCVITLNSSSVKSMLYDNFFKTFFSLSIVNTNFSLFMFHLRIYINL